MELFSAGTVQFIAQLGAMGVILFLYIHDRLLGEPRRMALSEKRVDELIGQFREERKEDRLVLAQLAVAVGKLEERIEQINRRA